MNPLKFRMAMDYLTRIKKVKPDLPDVFPASQAPIPPKKESLETMEAINRFVRDNPRQDMAGGGMLVQPGLGGVRQGYSGEYGPNIRKSTKTDSFEVQGVRGGKGGGKGGQKFYKTFNFDKYGGEKKALKAAKEYRDSFLNIKKDIGKFSKGRPVGSKLTTGGQAEIRKALNDIIKVGGKSFSNEDIKKLVDMDLFPDDDQFRKAVDVVKKEPAFKNLTFVDARSQKSKADYYTDPLIRKKIKENYKKLKQENLAKLVFPDEPLTTSKSRLGIILSDMADKGEIERLAVGKASEERIGEFDPSPESEKKARVGRRRRKKIDILGGKEYEKELFDFKKQVQESLGLEKVKKGKYDPIDMGHQSSLKQLKALKQSLRPEDLSPQFYKANQLGIQKYEGGVKTLENSLDRKFYPEQKKLYNQAKKFVDAGQEIPADLQNKIIKSNERIQIFIEDTVKKYPLLRDRVNAVIVNPTNLDVKRGGNVFKQLGIGLVDQDLGKIKTGSLDDLTIKANLAEQTLREAIDAGLIDKNIGRQRLDKFLNVRPIENSETKQIAQNLRNLGFKCKFAGSSGGLTRCDDPMSYVDDIKRQENLLKVQTSKAPKAIQTLNTARKLNAAKSLFTQTLGPGALAFEAVAALPIAYMGYKGGKTPANILADATYGLLGKTDQRILLDKAIELGYDTSNIKNVQDFYKKSDEFQKQSARADEFMGPEDLMMYPRMAQKAEEDLLGVTQKFLDPLGNVIPERKAGFEQLEKAQQSVFEDQAKLAAERQSKVGGFLQSPVTDYLPGLAGGGIAKLAGVDSGPPPASGPNSQGLQGLMKRVKRI